MQIHRITDTDRKDSHEEQKQQKPLILFCQKSDNPGMRLVMTEPDEARAKKHFKICSSDEKRPKLEFQVLKASKKHNVVVSFDFMDEQSSNTHSSNNCDYDEVAMSESTKTPKLLLNR